MPLELTDEGFRCSAIHSRVSMQLPDSMEIEMTEKVSTWRADDRAVLFGSKMFVALALGMLSFVKPVLAQDAKITQFPLAIICEFAGIQHVFYISKLQGDGVAVYARPDGVLATIGLSGPSAVIGGDGAAKGSCGGKTLDELRSAGQAVEFK
jgi:hypothetical protein